MKQHHVALASEYERIQSRVLEDPGTAGDEGEENWADLLRGWLPGNYPIVNKGRIVGLNGEASPQIDILVLNPAYPKKLLGTKHYLAGGVVAAFECKLTLRKTHFAKAFETGSIVKRLSKKREGTPYLELNRPIIYGVLAHSHALGKKPDLALSLLSTFSEEQFSGPREPDELLDFICIADLANYALAKTVNIQPAYSELGSEGDSDDLREFNHIMTGYICSWSANASHPHEGTVLGSFLSNLICKLAFEDASLRPIADYYREAMSKAGIALTTVWETTVLSESVNRTLRSKGASYFDPWDEWGEYL